MADLQASPVRWIPAEHAALDKPAKGMACNSCGYCCTVGPCQLAEMFLQCFEGPCAALEFVDGHSQCGLLRNPLGYIYHGAKPGQSLELALEPPSSSPASGFMRADFAKALGAGTGCDARDDDESRAWPASHRACA